MTATMERTNRKRVNNELHLLSQAYHSNIPLQQIDEILVANGFSATEPAIYCGREGRSNERVGDFTYLSLSWYKMNLGNYEITVYVS